MIYKNFLRFNQSKIINTDNSALPNKITRTMRHAVMPLLLYRLCSDVAKFYAFEKIQEPLAAKRRNKAQPSVWERNHIKAKSSHKFKKNKGWYVHLK